MKIAKRDIEYLINWVQEKSDSDVDSEFNILAVKIKVKRLLEQLIR